MGSNVLKNFIHHANAHNKYLEEAEMWKKRNDELKQNKYSEKRSRSRSSSVTFKKQKKINESEEKKEEIIGPSLKLFEDDSKWDHSGFKELYPNDYERKINQSHRESSSASTTSSSSEKLKKRSKHKKSKKKKKKKNKKKKD